MVVFVNGFRVRLGTELDMMEATTVVVVAVGFQWLIGLKVVGRLSRKGGRVLCSGSCGPRRWMLMEDMVQMGLALR